MTQPSTPSQAGELRVTESIGNVGEVTAGAWALAAREPTEDDVIGPYYRAGAPYRAKLSPPLVAGETLLIAGRVWDVRSRRPVPACILDVWQANAEGHYDNEDPRQPPPALSYVNRTRVHADQRGYYEIEAIFPGPYKMDPTTWRSPHVHFLVRAVGLRTLVTQLFFVGAPYLDTDPFVKKSLIIPLKEHCAPCGRYKACMFDIVLAGDIDEASRNAR